LSPPPTVCGSVFTSPTNSRSTLVLVRKLRGSTSGSGLMKPRVPNLSSSFENRVFTCATSRWVRFSK
jgi:hypothetical protein